MNERHSLLRMSSTECKGCRCVIGMGERRFKMGTAGVMKCFSCAATDPSLLSRAAYMSLIVGSILTIINQGTLIFHGSFPLDLAWKIPLTYAVPFCVSWASVMSASEIKTTEDNGIKV